MTFIRPMIRTFQLLLTAFAVCATSIAQAEVSMRLDIVAWGDEIRGLSLSAEGSGKPITARSFTYSEPVSYRGPELLEIHSTGDSGPANDHQPTADDIDHALIPLDPESAEKDADNATPKSALAIELEKRREKEPTLVALAKLPAGSRRATVLLAPASGGTYQAYIIDDDPTKLRPGQLRVHNLSPHPVAMRSPGKPAAELKIRGFIDIPANDGQVIYELAYQRDGKWIVQENNIIPVRENEQTQMMILRSNNRFFKSADGSTGGYLQVVFLRRLPEAADDAGG